jgi:hypothetical protein
MAKKDAYKNLASDMIKGLVSKPDTTPQQQVMVTAPKLSKRATTKFTVEIDTELMDELKIYGVTHKIKLRQLFEKSLKEYLKSNS